MTPTHVCYVSGLPQALLFCFKDVPFLKRRVLGSPKHVCYVSGLSQAFFLSFKKDMPFLKKVCFGHKLTFLNNIGQYLSNICQYLSMYIPTYYTVLRTAYCTVQLANIYKYSSHVYMYIYIYSRHTFSESINI